MLKTKVILRGLGLIILSLFLFSGCASTSVLKKKPCGKN